MQQSNFEKTDLSYDQVIWYRKRWFVIATVLVFAPATVLIGLTGDIYAKRDGAVYKFSEMYKNIVIFVAAFFIIQAILRAMK